MGGTKIGCKFCKKWRKLTCAVSLICAVICLYFSDVQNLMKVESESSKNAQVGDQFQSITESIITESIMQSPHTASSEEDTASSEEGTGGSTAGNNEGNTGSTGGNTGGNTESIIQLPNAGITGGNTGGNTESTIQLPHKGGAEKWSSLYDAYLNLVRNGVTGTTGRTPSHTKAAIEIFDLSSRNEGKKDCLYCFSTLGNFAMQTIRVLMESVIADKVPGDFLETDIWKGGASIMANAVLHASSETHRYVWACDSFKGSDDVMELGFNESVHNNQYIKFQNSAEHRDAFHTEFWKSKIPISVSIQVVQQYLMDFGLRANVHLVKGRLAQSLPQLRERLRSEGRQLAVLWVHSNDKGSSQDSHTEILQNFYGLVPVGGYVVCADCMKSDVAKQLVTKFRQHHGITEAIIESHQLMYWRKVRFIYSSQQDQISTQPQVVHGKSSSTDWSLRRSYLKLVRNSLTGTVGRTPGNPSRDRNYRIFHEGMRDKGKNGCFFCYTMAGNYGMHAVWVLLERVIADKVPGDFLETGVWKGGASIMARATLRAHGEEHRLVFSCDSYEGLPPASTKEDGDFWSKDPRLRVSKADVQDHFRRFSLLDENVHFIQGYFVHSLPIVRKKLQTENRQLALLRGDGDMYESYMDILYNLYEFIPVGGFFICDDCPGIEVAQKAIDEFREIHGLDEPIYRQNSSHGTYWRKVKNVQVQYERYLKWNQTRKKTNHAKSSKDALVPEGQLSGSDKREWDKFAKLKAVMDIR